METSYTPPTVFFYIANLKGEKLRGYFVCEDEAAEYLDENGDEFTEPVKIMPTAHRNL